MVNIGCGTGLSTLVWKDAADKIIGVEPSDDMIAMAITNAEHVQNIEFVHSFSDNIGLSDSIADIVTCSQSLHWMEPVSTLQEIARLLKPGGIFAAYDYDGSPVCGTNIELACQILFDKVSSIEDNHAEYKQTFIRYPKNQHLANIRNSGYFKFAREIVFANITRPPKNNIILLVFLPSGFVCVPDIRMYAIVLILAG